MIGLISERRRTSTKPTLWNAEARPVHAKASGMPACLGSTGFYERVLPRLKFPVIFAIITCASCRPTTTTSRRNFCATWPLRTLTCLPCQICGVGTSEVRPPQTVHGVRSALHRSLLASCASRSSAKVSGERLNICRSWSKGNTGSTVRNALLRTRMHGQVKSGSPVLLRDFAQSQFVHPDLPFPYWATRG
jgi:hypothetical protein